MISEHLDQSWFRWFIIFFLQWFLSWPLLKTKFFHNNEFVFIDFRTQELLEHSFMETIRIHLIMVAWPLTESQLGLNMVDLSGQSGMEQQELLFRYFKCKTFLSLAVFCTCIVYTWVISIFVCQHKSGHCKYLSHFDSLIINTFLDLLCRELMQNGLASTIHGPPYTD